MSDNVKDVKRKLRNQYKQYRLALPADVKADYDKKICEALVQLVSFKYSDTILMYAPLEGEIDVMPIAERALELGKRVAFPRCIEEPRNLDFKYVSSLDELKSGSYSIAEPTEDMESVTDLSRSICIIPGIVFDKDGYRVGYGKGYYDRFLAAYDGTKFGLAYSECILDSVPRGRFDRHVDILISEKGVKLAKTK
jgi:5-formyltetrahydrofolate cyclo-ligase